MDANLPEILVGIDGPGDDLIDHLPKAMRRASLSAEEIEELLRFNHPNRERHRRYVLIDEISGHVWGDVVAADPIKACRAIDTRCGQHKRKKYTDIGSAPFDGHPGYPRNGLKRPLRPAQPMSELPRKLDHEDPLALSGRSAIEPQSSAGRA
jgi:hypothetical protein